MRFFILEYEKTIDALLDSNVFSDAGREEYVRVVLKIGMANCMIPWFWEKIPMISSLAAADGYITIRLDQGRFIS